LSFHGVTKGTKLEKQVDELLGREARAVGMYYGLAMLAKDKGLNDVADTLLKLGDDEARHAGLYTVLNAHVPPDVFAMIAIVADMESNAVKHIKAFAQQVRELGLDKAAQEIETVADDEGHHAQVLQELVKRHAKSGDK
jgi:rubrerythrin